MHCSHAVNDSHWAVLSGVGAGAVCGAETVSVVRNKQSYTYKQSTNVGITGHGRRRVGETRLRASRTTREASVAGKCVALTHAKRQGVGGAPRTAALLTARGTVAVLVATRRWLWCCHGNRSV